MPSEDGHRHLADNGSWPLWFPSGKHIGYRSIGPDGTQRIHVVPLEGGEPKVLSGLRFTGTNNPFDISPDLNWIATANGVPVLTEIWLLQSHPQK